MTLNKINLMDLKTALNIILNDIKEAGELIDDLRNKPDFPELQIELARSKCKSAEDMIRLISNIIIEQKTVRQDNLKVSDLTVDEPEKADISIEIAENPADKESDTISSQKSAELIREEISEEKKRPAYEEIKKSDKILADKFAHLSGRINEKVGDSKKTEGKTRTLPVTDLNKSIGVNDRFFFIRELFDGDEGRYRQTVQMLNEVTSKDEAADILKEAAPEQSGSEPALQLLELVERKLSAK